MGDAHFLLQNSLTGLVFLVFTFATFWMFDSTNATKTLSTLSTQWQIAALLVTTPVLGILIQGFWMFVAYMWGHPYKDPARQKSAEMIRSALQASDGVPEEIKRRLTKLPDDSLFVWLYYTKGPMNLIEWTRRRRTFQHLGENWLTGAFLGLILGSVAAIVISTNLLHSHMFQMTTFISFTILWMTGLGLLRYKMKLDADTVDLVWLYHYLYPEIEDQLVDMPGKTSRITTKADLQALSSSSSTQQAIQPQQNTLVATPKTGQKPLSSRARGKSRQK